MQIPESDRLLVDPVVPEDRISWNQAVLGPGLGLLVSRREPVAFHASCVSHDQQAVVIAGRKGAGKSTLAASLCARGWDLISDDATVVRMAEDDPEVIPSYPQLKVREEVVDRVGIEPEQEVKLPTRSSKRIWHVPHVFRGSSVSLRAIVLVEPGTDLTIRPLTGREAVMRLVEHLYPLRFIGRGGMEENHLRDCATLASRLNVSILSRPDDVGRIDGVVRRIDRLLS